MLLRGAARNTKLRDAKNTFERAMLFESLSNALNRSMRLDSQAIGNLPSLSTLFGATTSRISHIACEVELELRLFPSAVCGKSFKEVWFFDLLLSGAWLLLAQWFRSNRVDSSQGLHKAFRAGGRCDKGTTRLVC